jgi:hypothetical protein
MSSTRPAVPAQDEAAGRSAPRWTGAPSRNRYGISSSALVTRTATADRRARLGEQRLVGRRLPRRQPVEEREQALALVRLLDLGREPLGVGRRVVDERGEQHRARRRERPARPPEVQRRRVAVADRLLARGLAVDRLQGQRDLDQLLLHVPLPRSASASGPTLDTVPQSPYASSTAGP